MASPCLKLKTDNFHIQVTLSTSSLLHSPLVSGVVCVPPSIPIDNRHICRQSLVILLTGSPLFHLLQWSRGLELGNFKAKIHAFNCFCYLLKCNNKQIIKHYWVFGFLDFKMERVIELSSLSCDNSTRQFLLTFHTLCQLYLNKTGVKTLQTGSGT